LAEFSAFPYTEEFTNPKTPSKEYRKSTCYNQPVLLSPTLGTALSVVKNPLTLSSRVLHGVGNLHFTHSEYVILLTHKISLPSPSREVVSIITNLLILSH
jgi:hypothetical protein